MPGATRCWSCTPDIALRLEGDALVGTVALGAGERRYLSLAYTKGDPAVLPPLGKHAEERIADTIHWWREWAGRCRYDGPYREQVVRSVVTLKLLTYALSGAIVAAPTTSLPEAIGKGRNWDYRYCWLRDAGLTTQALLATGYREEAMAFLGWMLHATRLSWPELQVMYDVFGRTRLDEQRARRISRAIAGSRPVRIGNDAYRQRQLDIYGEVVTAAHAALAGNGRLDAESARMLHGAGRRGVPAVARVRLQHLGSARAAAPLHLLQGHVLGGARRAAEAASMTARSSSRRRRSRRSAASARRSSRRSSGAASTPPSAAMPACWTATRSTPRCC